jgi:hypothetical protein
VKGLFKNHNQFSTLFLKQCFHLRRKKGILGFRYTSESEANFFAFYSKACLPLSGLTSKVDRTLKKQN